MHTDGIRDDYELDPKLFHFPKKLAHELAYYYRNPLDDALVLVVNDLLNKIE